MFVHAVHVSDILLKTLNMNETYLVGEENSVPKTTITTDSNDSNVKPKCNTSILFACTCIITVVIIGGFSFLFGPLILNRTYPLYRFSPSHITVQHYRLRLEPNFSLNQSNQSDFHGRASIILHSARRINELRLISHDLHIEKINLTLRNQINLAHDQSLTHLPSLKQNETGRSYHIGKVTHIQIEKIYEIWYYNHKELIILLKKPLEVGDYMMDIHYSSQFHPLGLERTTYEEKQNGVNKTKYLITMNSVSRVLPYFDNNQKIKFELSVRRKTDAACFTNVPFREIEPIKSDAGYLWEHFKTTPQILPSTLAIVIADYKSVNVSTSSSVLLKLFAPKKDHAQLSYARHIFPKIFEYFERYFQMKYPLSKLDLLLVDDAVTPLTSKLGLITLNSEYLLMDIIDDHIENRRKIFYAISESVALQFLQIKLNYNENKELLQAFATFLAYNAEYILNNQVRNDVDQIESNWNREEYFIEKYLENSLDNYGSNKELKMACVLRMINYTLNENVFQMGLSTFLLNSNEDFWESAQNLHLRGNATTKELLLSWWNNPGYPIVTITRTTGWNVLIEQESIIAENVKHDLFTIPLTYLSKNQNNVSLKQEFTLSNRQILTNLFVPQDDWILLNYNRIGYYRVNYHKENWYKLIKQLEEQPSVIPVINRAALINDAFALADEGLLQFEVAFDLINYLRRGNESNYLPWRAALDAINRHAAVFLDSSQYGIFRKFKIDLLSHLWPIRLRLNTKLTQMIETELCQMQYKPCIHSALEFYDTYKNRRDVVIPQWVYCTVLTHSQEDVFDLLYQRVKQSGNYNEIRVLLQSLTCTKISWKINSLLEESFDNINYAKYIWAAMAKSSMSRLTGIVFLEESPIGDGIKSANESISGEGTEVWKIVNDEFLSSMSTTTNLNKIIKISANLNHVLQRRLNNTIVLVNKQIEWSKHYLSSFVEELSKERY